ncbi:MAG TPA: hypothetical protein VI142_07710 [Gaiellaceae bacterium]
MLAGFSVEVDVNLAVRPEGDAFAAEQADQAGNETLRTLDILSRYADDHRRFLRYDDRYDATDR